MTNSASIFFDLDGTLINITDKYYHLYADFMQIKGLSARSQTDFWRLKRRKATSNEILKNPALVDEFQSFFRDRIESPQYLHFDQPFPFALKTLKQLHQSGHQLYLVTLRRNHSTLQQQLDRFNFPGFNQVFSGHPDDRGSKFNYEQKITLLKNVAEPHDIIVGDSSADMRCGRALKLKTIGVLSGISNYRTLVELTPDHIFRDIHSLTRKKL